MEVKINKEIRNYTESMFFGLSLRQFIFSVLACGVAVLQMVQLSPSMAALRIVAACMWPTIPLLPTTAPSM